MPTQVTSPGILNLATLARLREIYNPIWWPKCKQNQISHQISCFFSPSNDLRDSLLTGERENNPRATNEQHPPTFPASVRVLFTKNLGKIATKNANLPVVFNNLSPTSGKEGGGRISQI